MGINGPNLDAYFQVDGVGGGRNRAKSEVEQLPRGWRWLGRDVGLGQDEHARDINTIHNLLLKLPPVASSSLGSQYSIVLKV